MNGTPSQSAEIINAFVAKFEAVFSEIPVDRVDERFTSKMAFQTMIDSGLNKKQRQNKALVDEKVVPMMNKTKATNPTWGIKKGNTKKIAPSVRAIKIILTVPKRCKIPTDKGFISVTPAGRERSNKPNWASSSSNFCLR
jgi:hypothetical protein